MPEPLTITPAPQAIPSGDAVVRIPDEFGAASTLFGGEWLMRRMMRDPWLGLADSLIRALVLEGEHQVVPAVGDLPPDATPEEKRRKAMADKVAAFHDAWISSLRRPLRRVLWHSMEALAYGHKLCEIEWDVVAGGGIAPVDIAPKPRTAYTLKLDRANRLEGAQPFGSAAGLVPPTSLFVFSLCGRDDDPGGTPALERAYEAWYRKGCAKPNETKALAAFAGGLSWVESDIGVSSTVETRVDGRTETKLASQVIAEEAAKMKVGRVPAFPPGWHYKQVPPATSFAAFDSVYGRCDREMVTAFFVAARSVLEAQFGSRADSETASGLVDSIKDWLRGELCEALKSQVLMVATIANFGPAAAEFCPSYDIVTEERGELGAVMNAVQQADASGILTPELVDHFLSLVGVPDAVRRAVAEAMEGLQAETPEPEPETDPEPGQRFDDRGSAKKAPKADAKAAKAADKGAQRIVDRYDRSLRKLTARWSEGRLSDDSFAERFADLLSSGHEEAARLGARLAGHKGERLPAAVREYVAATLGDEGDFLSDLIQEVKDGTRTAAQANLAARRYAQRMGGTVCAAFHEASPEDSEFWWQLGKNEGHCEDCPRLAKMSPFLKDELITRPREGETQCVSGCLCRLVRGDGACAPGPVKLGSY